MTTLERIASAVGEIEDQTALIREALGHLALNLIDSDQLVDGGYPHYELMRSLVGEIRDLLEKTSGRTTDALCELKALRQANGEVKP